MKKILLTCTALAFAVGISSAAMAQGNSEPGGDRYNEIGSNPNPDAQCDTQAGSGAFGYWGKDFNRGIQNEDQHPDRGAGTQHGFNNAVVCGSPTDSAPPD